MMRGSEEWEQGEKYRAALDRLAELQAGTDDQLGPDLLAQMALEARRGWVAEHGEPDSDESRLDLYAHIARHFYEQGMKIEPRDGAQCPITTNSGHGETRPEKVVRAISLFSVEEIEQAVAELRAEGADEALIRPYLDALEAKGAANV